MADTYCANCRAPIDGERIARLQIDGIVRDVCQVCHDMHAAVAGRPWLSQQQTRWEQKKRSLSNETMNSDD